MASTLDAEALASRTDRLPEVLVLLSGGIDSSACLDFYLSLHRPVCAMHVDYGQGAAGQERTAATAIAAFYGASLLFRGLDLATIKSIGEIPGRNAFLVFAALMERPASVGAIAVGIHAGTNYPDCSPAFVEAMNQLFHPRGRVELLAPFIEWEKADIVHYCKQRAVPVHLTYSCERGGPIPCGECLSCVDRKLIDACA